MTTPKAIASLRASMGLTQREFAEKLGTRIETVSRWETGRREPTKDAMERLAVLAHKAGEKHLRTFFVAQEVSGIINRVRGLRSPGSERHIALKELKFWSAYLHETIRTSDEIIENANQPGRKDARKVLEAIISNSRFVMDHIRDRIELYIDEQWSPTRQQEDKEILNWGYRQGMVKVEPDGE
jgi:transcriptional regulator with XRE-family HTH domain